MSDDEAHPEAPRPSISAEHARSWLLVNARQDGRYDEAAATDADAIVLDLEDAVDPRHKDDARAAVRAWLLAGHRAWVRINDVTTEFWSRDVDGLAGVDTLEGFILAKVEAPEKIIATHRRLGPDPRIVPLVESARGLEMAGHMARTRGTFRLAFGSGDFRRDTGMHATREAMAYARSRLAVASAAAGLPGAIDGPTTDRSLRTLREQSEWTLEYGLTGKLCLDGAQTTVVNEVIRPQTSDIAWAESVIEEFDASGGVVRDGSDLPRLGRARKILGLADAFGLR